MKFIILFVTVSAVIASVQSQLLDASQITSLLSQVGVGQPRKRSDNSLAEDTEARVESAHFERNKNGYKYGYKTSNNIQIEEKMNDFVEGSYSYVDPDGRTHTVTYIAGAGIGFKPLGDDIHPEVSAAIELNLKNPPQETTTLKNSEAKTLKQKESRALKEPEATTLKESEATTLKQSEATTLKQSEATTLKESEATTSKQSESTTSKQSESTTLKQAE